MSSSSIAFAPRQAIPILSYHQTGAVPKRGSPFRSLVLPPARFARQMRALQRMGWQGLSMQALEPYLRGTRQGKVFGITLDDGYVNNYEHALPVLTELGFSATAFAVSARVGGTNRWDATLGVPEAPLMNLQQLRAWTDAGMEVGAHTRHHVDLLNCDHRYAREEIAGSKAELEQQLGHAVRSFCYPYGHYRAEHVEMAREAGFVTATTTDSSRVQANADLLRLPRITVWLSTSLPLLLAKVATGYEDWRHHAGRSAVPAWGRWLGAANGPTRGRIARDAWH